jgi:hypothetical protein
MAYSLLFLTLKKVLKSFRKLIFSQLIFSYLNQFNFDKVTDSIFLITFEQLKYLPLLKLINI